MDISSLTRDEFLELLQRGTDGLWQLEAAVWLLDHRGEWLTDARLRRYTLGGIDEEGNRWAGFEVQRIHAAIDAGEFGDEGADRNILRIAMSLYGDYRISLRYAMDDLSEEDLAAVCESLHRACGFSG
ncbi:hypothetical protein ACFZAV_11300 [Streptomyces sp. NPDC008343]|uniref:hypothetical protein n=1 Tax=Streptomyces sp. NPDC008343 TaxID=3364828 RepID=UPI0036EB6D71